MLRKATNKCSILTFPSAHFVPFCTYCGSIPSPHVTIGTLLLIIKKPSENKKNFHRKGHITYRQYDCRSNVSQEEPLFCPRIGFRLGSFERQWILPHFTSLKIESPEDIRICFQVQLLCKLLIWERQLCHNRYALAHQCLYDIKIITRKSHLT